MAAAKIVEIEAEMARTQKNKATAKHLGILKAKLSKLKAEVNGIGTKGAGGKPGDGFDVTKSGDTRVGLVGFPSVGKSTLLTMLTGTASEAAAYEFTTLTAIPGTLMYRGAKIQIVDLPGIIEGAKDGKGRGRQVIGTARTCNLILIVIDATKPLTHKHIITRELEGFGIRLNKEEPNITIRKTDKGGVTHRSDGEQKHLDADTIRAICSEYKMSNCDVNIRYANATIEDLIDVLSTRTVYIPALFVLNKIDAISIQELELYSQVPHYVPLSAKDKWNVDELLTKIWDRCQMTRIYTKPKGQIPDFASPVILHNKAPTVKEFCDRIHKTMINQFKYAWVWGRSVKHQPQRVGAAHVLDDEDVIQIVKK